MPVVARQLLDVLSTSDDFYWGYWWMFPIAIVIASTAMTFGIGGAAFFSPCFVILFPLVGVPTLTASESFFAALFTELFGFSSGLLGYVLHGLVDWRTAALLGLSGAPFAMIGAVVALLVPSSLLYLLFALGLFVLAGMVYWNYRQAQKTAQRSPGNEHALDNDSVVVISASKPEKSLLLEEDDGIQAADEATLEVTSGPAIPWGEDRVSDLSEYIADRRSQAQSEGMLAVAWHLASVRLVRDRKGNVYFYTLSGLVAALILTVLGSFATGIISVGIGETTVTSLRRARVPPRFVRPVITIAVSLTYHSVAAATSVAVTFIVVLFGVGTGLLIQLVDDSSSVPWDLVIWTVPGVCDSYPWSSRPF